MKTKFKFILLSILACLASVLIYKYVSNNAEIKYNSLLVEKEEEINKVLINDTNYTYDDPKVILDPYNVSPLTALIVFETNDYTSPTITVVGKDSNTTITNTFKANTKHYLPIYGLYPNTDNKVILNVNGNAKELIIKTKELPDDFVKVESIYSNKNKLNNELYFVSPSSNGYTAAYDINGDVRWYLTTKIAWDIKRLDNGNLLVSTDRLINNPYYMTGLYEMDLLGKIYFEYTLPNGYHHDALELPNNNLLVATNNFDSDTVEDYIVEIDRNTGNIVKEIDLNKIIDSNEGFNCNYSIDYDWFHNNSIWYDEKTNSLLISGRHVDAVLNIDYDTLDINYIIGDPTNWSSKYTKYFLKGLDTYQYAQHAAMMLPNGNVFLFDNGNNKTKSCDNIVSAKDNYSRAVIYDIDETNMTIKEVFSYGNLDKTYSPYISDVDYLDNNHYLINFGGYSETNGVANNTPSGLNNSTKLLTTIVELLNNEVIFKMTLPNNTYRIEKLSLYSNNSYIPNYPIRLGSFNETKSIKNKDILTFSKYDKDILDKYNIELTEELDRFILTGTFDKSDKVEIILDNVFKRKTYNMVISTRPYTSMCIDLFNDTLTLSKYISKTNLKGKYFIYLKINGKVYKTNQYIYI